MFAKALILLVALVAISAIPPPEHQHDPEVENVHEMYFPEEINELLRFRRSIPSGASNFPQASRRRGKWSVNPDLGRDESGNTRGQVEINHKGRNHDFNAGWGKVFRGPNRAKPTWHIGGTWRW
ncbi:hypothetical protein Zmor_007891 [Zophobas morio]|uniref:Uncharacterized protein n=1 Tax=Zophobas morio TaxID=2755281 RepID=A0AA38J179_9CUCU|nr:hypothetical protein Zmor_007891 [Zophobas morio]